LPDLEFDVPNTHRSIILIKNLFYRLPEDVYQTAKILKLLILMDKGVGHKFKGKSLNEIDIDPQCELAETDNESDNNGDEQDITNVLTSNNFKKLKTSNRAVSKGIQLYSYRYETLAVNYVADVFTAANPSYSPPSPDEGAFSQGGYLILRKMYASSFIL
jgi:hypothetical protein